MIEEELENPSAAAFETKAYESKPHAKPDTIKATVALICGAASIVCAVFIPLIGAPAGIVFGIIAIVLGASFIKKNGLEFRAKLGRLCGIVGLIISILLFTLALTGHTLAAIIDLDDSDVEVSVEV